MSYEVLQSRVPFDGKVIRVRVDEIRHSSGREMRYELIEHVGSVVMVPLDEHDQIWFVRQYRHPVGQRLLELPAGTLDPGEKPMDCAVRECREEIGMSPGRMTGLGGCYLAPGYSNEFAHFFLAQDLSPDPLEMEEDEDIIVEKLGLQEVKAILSRGEINDAKTIVGLSLVLAYRGEGFAA
jgi:ADP-ribose pyrophosphatase